MEVNTRDKAEPVHLAGANCELKCGTTTARGKLDTAEPVPTETWFINCISIPHNYGLVLHSLLYVAIKIVIIRMSISASTLNLTGVRRPGAAFSLMNDHRHISVNARWQICTKSLLD